MDTFEQRKKAAMAELASPAPDKSPKGGVDAAIIPLLDLINRHPSYFTTSSCSGRISILLSPPQTLEQDEILSNDDNNNNKNNTNENNKKKKKAGGGRWLFVSHEPADPELVVRLLFEGERKEGDDEVFDVVFRFEPLIVAVDCRDLDAARVLVGAAISAGFRESGITSLQKRIMVAIRCSIRMEVPLGQFGNLCVLAEYVNYLVGIANSKMEANKNRSYGFLHSLQSKGLLEGAKSISVDRKEILVKRKQDNSDFPLSREESDALNNGGESTGTGLKLDDCNIEFSSLFEDEQRDNETNKRSTCDSSRESQVDQNHSLSSSILNVNGEPIEKLFLWGQSACAISDNSGPEQVLIFGGFGGLGQHSRRNYALILNPKSGLLSELNASGPPLERMGHTVTVVGERIFVIGGRAAPVEILSDVWVLKLGENKWVQVECTGDLFGPRHRHSATVIGSNIYVFGGLHDKSIYSSMFILNTEKMQWREVEVSTNEEWPCPRHSHSMVGHNSQLFLFGGHNGHKPLGDLYSFDTTTLKWKRVITIGKPPFPRFSHSMFVYNNYIGVLGGCPLKQQENQCLALLDLDERVWVHVKIESVGKSNIWVRNSAVVINEELILVGGGSSCYAFGTMFSPPMKIDLSSVKFSDFTMANLVFQVEKMHAKGAKDILKKFGWLDVNRKVRVTQDGVNVLFPVNRDFCNLFNDEGLKCEKEDALDEDPLRVSLKFLMSCGGYLESDTMASGKKGFRSPLNVMREHLCPLLEGKGLPLDLLEQLPTRWEHLGDIVILPKGSFRDPLWDSIGQELWQAVAKSLGAQRLARQGRIKPTGTRDSMLELLLGDNGWVTHSENGISYSLDATKCMFSSGNRSEKLRMAGLDCTNEVVVDLFAGIGYFMLPFLVKANAKLVYACEWNPHALSALSRNIKDNCVADRCIIIEGDNRLTAPKGVANRVCLGLLPSSECSWVTAVRALRTDGGILHIHGNVNDSEETSWLDYVVKSISNISKDEGLSWNVSLEHVERVKWYGPRIRHLVADIRCKQT